MQRQAGISLRKETKELMNKFRFKHRDNDFDNWDDVLIKMMNYIDENKDYQLYLIEKQFEDMKNQMQIIQEKINLIKNE